MRGQRLTIDDWNVMQKEPGALEAVVAHDKAALIYAERDKQLQARGFSDHVYMMAELIYPNGHTENWWHHDILEFDRQGSIIWDGPNRAWFDPVFAPVYTLEETREEEENFTCVQSFFPF